MLHVKHHFISLNHSNNLIEFYNKSNNVSSFRDTFPLNISKTDNGLVNSILSKVKDVAEDLVGKKLFLDNAEIVLWPEGSFMDMHFDHETDEIAVILYLNDDYIGGETEFIYQGEKKKINPEAGKALFFKGTDIDHGVSRIEKGSRYTLAVWYTR